jgi:hypothetical protein
MKNRNKKSPAGLAARTGQAIGTSEFYLSYVISITTAALNVNTPGGGYDPRT